MPRSMLQHRAGRVGQILPQDIMSVLIVARKKGKGNEKKARIQDYLGHAPRPCKVGDDHGRDLRARQRA
nr:MAG TPA: hypothetical protein [Caudoviricetes sp.]